MWYLQGSNWLAIEYCSSKTSGKVAKVEERTDLAPAGCLQGQGRWRGRERERERERWSYTYLSDINSSCPFPIRMPLSQFSHHRDWVEPCILSQCWWNHFHGFCKSPHTVSLHSLQCLRVLHQSKSYFYLWSSTTSNEGSGRGMRGETGRERERQTDRQKERERERENEYNMHVGAI